MAKKIVFTIVIIVSLLIIGQGCYTILKHPNVEFADHSYEYYSKNCRNCHDVITEYPYGYGYSSFPGYWEDYHNYGLYYTFPWWWESYWWDIDLEPNEKYSPTGADRRRGIIIPQGDNVPPPAEITNQSPTPGGSGDGGISTGDESGEGDSKQKDRDSSKKDTEQKKTERRRLP